MSRGIASFPLYEESAFVESDIVKKNNIYFGVVPSGLLRP